MHVMHLEQYMANKYYRHLATATTILNIYY